MKLSRTISLLFAVMLMMSCAQQNTSKEPPVARDGIIDLRGWDFIKDGPVKLDGDWEFYWKQLLAEKDFAEENLPEQSGYIKIPGIWNNHKLNNEKLGADGYATFKLTILMDKPGKFKPTLMLGHIGSAYKLFINGKTISQNGRVATFHDNELPSCRPISVSIYEDSLKWSLLLQVSNYHHLRSWHSIKLGDDFHIRSMEKSQLRVDWFLFGSILIMGFYHFTLYALRRNDLSLLWFGIFCLLLALRTLATRGNYLYWIIPENYSWIALKIEYLTFFSAIPVFLLFMQSLFPKEFSSKLLKVVCVIGSIVSLLVIFMPARIYANLLTFYHIFTISCCIYCLYVLSLTLKNRREGSVMILIGFIILFFTTANDILYARLIIKTADISSIGFILFLFCQSVVLSIRSSKAFVQIEALSNDLAANNARLLELDKIKDEILANTSHELRTPLNGIIGLTESLIDGIFGNLPDAVKGNLEMIISSGKRLTSLINGILDFSKLKSSEINLRFQVVDICEIADEVLKLSTPLMSGKPVVMENELLPETPLVEADDSRLQQVLFNLVGNAIKFTEKGSITLSAQHNDKTVTISVTDTGIGIPENKHESIFNSFEQADGSIEREFAGTGLGLAISKSLIELHGGSIWVESEQGLGSTFSFTLRVAPQQVKTKKAKNREVLKSVVVDTLIRRTTERRVKEVPPPGGIERRITLKDRREIMPAFDFKGISALVVDDEPINLHVINNTLSLTGINVEMTNSGMNAIERLKARKPDIILMDIMMPNMNGFEATQKIREIYKKEELPIIFLTAKNQVSDLVDAFSAGGNDYIAKPISKNELIARVNFHIGLTRSRNQVTHLLEVTKDMAKSDNIISACVAAHSHLFSLGGESKFKKADIYIPQHSSESFTGYTIWIDGGSVEVVIPYNAPPAVVALIKSVDKFRRDKNRIFVPIKTSSQILAVIMVELDSDDTQFSDTFFEIMEGLYRSLSLTIETIELQDNRKLAGIGSMAAAIVHDLRNSIGVVIGYAEAAADKNCDIMLQQGYLDIITKEANRMSDMAHEVLEFSTGVLVLNRTKIESKEYSEDLDKALAPIFEKKQIAFKQDVQYRGMLNIDAERIRRVVLNIASNAADAMFVAGTSDALFTLTITKEEDYVVFSAKDNGPGIPKKI